MPSRTSGTGTNKLVSDSQRSQVWQNTPNYVTVAKRDLPENSYEDNQYRTAQADYGGDFREQHFLDGSSPVTTFYTATGPRLTTSVLAGFVYSKTVEIQTEKLPSTSTVDNLLRIKILGKIADQKTNIAVMFAEASKTSDLILSTAGRLYRAYKSLRRGNFSQVARELNISPKSVHKTWLEYKYGWMPLLMDVKGAAEFFAQQHCSRPVRFSVRAAEKFDYSRIDSFVGTHNPGGSLFVPVTETVIGSTVFKVKAIVELTNPHLSAIQQLGLTNPALVAWELVPFSFVFDWFISVGDWLTALTALHGVSIVRTMKSTTTVCKVTRTYPKQENILDAVGSFERCSGETFGGELRAYIRAPGFVIDSLTWPPVNGSTFGFQKMITSLALLRGNAGRFGR